MRPLTSSQALRSDWVVVDAGAGVTCLCSSSGGLITEPSEVALDRLGARHGRMGAIVFPLPTSTPEDVTSHWRRLALGLGSRPLIVDRPIALALGLGLSAETDRAHLLIEVTTDFVEISVVSRGAVIDEHLIRGEPESWATLIEMVGAVLIEIDPDHEFDIREEGLHLVARDPESELLARPRRRSGDSGPDHGCGLPSGSGRSGPDRRDDQPRRLGLS